MRLEPELWDALSEICERERLSMAELIHRAESSGRGTGRTSAVRVYAVNYFRRAATDHGHREADHGHKPVNDAVPSGEGVHAQDGNALE
jgi:predicted DNA-binding ribbon-helix-helix protein